MCGITGIANLHSDAPIDEADLRRMLALIRHRGPDQFGIYLDDRVGLGSARLSIVDLAGGQQPIANEDETLWIVFNGEIFNHVELRRELERDGHRFATSSDTEVLLHLYEQHGPACLQRLNGQFAFAIWDARAQRLFLARDRLGVRPLFYTLADGALIFGSEIKAILADKRVSAELNLPALDQVFTYWSAQGEHTLFRNIVALPPGHYLLASERGVTVERYWQLEFPSATAPDARAEGDYVEELRELLVDATRIRLRADVPVGAYLSGGLDSSTIAAIIRRYTSSPLETFSIAFSDPAYDESEHQRRMASFLGTEHQVVSATHAEIGGALPAAIWHTETPLLRTAPVPMFLLAQRARARGYKVVLTGEGADEFLAGYDIFKEAAVRRFWARQPESRLRPLLLRKLYPDIRDLASVGGAYLAAFFREGLADVDAPGYSHALRWRTSTRAQRFFSADLHEAIAAHERYQPTYPNAFQNWHPLQRAQYLEVDSFLSPYLLAAQGDRVAMAHGVEGRFPFLDYRVVEFCNRLPPRLKLRGLSEKYLLRRLAEPWLPPDIHGRTKRPFRAPIQRSLFGDAALDYVGELLAPEAVRASGLFKPAAVSQLAQKAAGGARLSETDEMALVGILSTQLLVRQFVTHFRPPPPLAATDDVKVCRRGLVPHV